MRGRARVTASLLTSLSQWNPHQKMFTELFTNVNHSHDELRIYFKTEISKRLDYHSDWRGGMFGWDINIRYNMLNSVKSNKVFTFHPFDCCFLKYLLFIKGINRTDSWSPIWNAYFGVTLQQSGAAAWRGAVLWRGMKADKEPDDEWSLLTMFIVIRSDLIIVVTSPGQSTSRQQQVMPIIDGKKCRKKKDSQLYFELLWVFRELYCRLLTMLWWVARAFSLPMSPDESSAGEDMREQRGPEPW